MRYPWAKRLKGQRQLVIAPTAPKNALKDLKPFFVLVQTPNAFLNSPQFCAVQFSCE